MMISWRDEDLADPPTSPGFKTPPLRCRFFVLHDADQTCQPLYCNLTVPLAELKVTFHQKTGHKTA